MKHCTRKLQNDKAKIKNAQNECQDKTKTQTKQVSRSNKLTNRVMESNLVVKLDWQRVTWLR